MSCTCSCHKPTLDSNDLRAMYKAGKYEDINQAYAEGRFNFNQEDTK